MAIAHATQETSIDLLQRLLAHGSEWNLENCNRILHLWSIWNSSNAYWQPMNPLQRMKSRPKSFWTKSSYFFYVSDEGIWYCRVEERRHGIVDISRIGSRAKLLGRFVARRMSGPDPRNPCVDHQLDIHVREIRESIRTTVIPLGRLRVGSYLERALLFKVLADRICLPSALVRGGYGKSWNEIAIPQVRRYFSIRNITFVKEISKFFLQRLEY